MTNILDLKLIDKKDNYETYEGKMKILIKKIQKRNENQIYYYKSKLQNKKIYDIFSKDNYIYIYYDITENFDEIINDKENKEVKSFSICEPIKIKEIKELYKKEDAMCKIISQKIINGKLESVKSTGFFLELDIEDIPFKKCLLTSNYILNEEYIEKSKNISFEYKDGIKSIGMKEGRKVYTNKDLNYGCIEIYDKDDIKDYFKIDNKIIGKSLEIFKDKDIFILQYQKGNELSFSNGIILEIKDNKMIHNCSTNNYSVGSPIISRYSNNSIIGLNIGLDDELKINLSTNIISIIDNIKNYNQNYIIAEFNIKEEDVNKEIQIINSFEEYKRNDKYAKDEEDDYKYQNEKEIKENCEISINNNNIPFSYKYIFKIKGKYKIQYSFKNKITNMSYMFYNCKCLINLNLSQFDSQSVIKMVSMFSICENLTKINFSNFNTKKVDDMTHMFYDCNSLTNLNLSNFNTQNVKNMWSMFQYCTALTNIDLSNFNTQNVTDMHQMFESCRSLTNIDLSNFNTQNVTTFSYMFKDCDSLININISNFNTQNASNLSYMFCCCKSLINIDLSNFNTQNVSIFCNMFYGCESLININLSNFNLQKAYSLSGMFMNCKSLKDLDLSSFNAENVENFSYMFSGCKSLTNINLSNLNIQKAKYLDCIFAWCKSLKKEGIITNDEKFKNFIDNYFN